VHERTRDPQKHVETRSPMAPWGERIVKNSNPHAHGGKKGHVRHSGVVPCIRGTNLRAISGEAISWGSRTWAGSDGVEERVADRDALGHRRSAQALVVVLPVNGGGACKAECEHERMQQSLFLGEEAH